MFRHEEAVASSLKLFQTQINVHNCNFTQINSNPLCTPHPSAMILVQICLYCLNCMKFG